MTPPTDPIQSAARAGGAPHPDAETLIGLSHRMADAAGTAALRHFRATGLTTEDKGGKDGFDPVTAGDREAEAAMRRLLAEERPGDGILGEEHGQVTSSTGLTWVLDPIDGTRAFIAGLPTWGVLIALDDGKAGRIGIVDQPFTGERFVGQDLTGVPEARLMRAGHETSIQVRSCADLKSAILFTTAPELFDGAERPRFEAVRARTRLTRYGVDCYAYALLAAGQIDLVIESGLESYDIAAPAALIRAAGGIVTDWEGGDPRWGGRVVAAGDPRVHAAAMELLGATG
ncbi:MAG: inositol monophosphatase family protein [Pseudomonadota bacterium]